MSTLAEELAQDFESSGSEDGGDQHEAADGLLHNGSASHSKDLDDDLAMTGTAEIGELLDTDQTDVRLNQDMRGVSDVRSVASLMDRLTPVLQVSQHHLLSPQVTRYGNEVFTSLVSHNSPDSFRQKIASLQAQAPSLPTGNVEDDPEYHLLTSSNSLSTSIDSEIAIVHKFIRDHYSVRFPELEKLVENPLEYAKAVAILGNGPMDSESIKQLSSSTNNPIKTPLRAVLDGPTLMIVTVEATTSKGREMSPEELERVTRACLMVLALDDAKRTLTSYVQSRMNIFAPNLTALIGSLTAAQLLNAAGGLLGLSKTPACNVPSWGAKKRSGAGYATNVGIRQQGFLFHSPIVQSVPNDMKKQAMRIVAAKVVLAARTDSIHNFADGSMGEDLRQGILDRLDKLQEKPLNKGGRALPAPDEKPSRKRGGRQARAMKEATAMTELRKAQNRMGFNKEEKEVGYGTGETTAGLGMIGQANDGRVRGIQIDQRTRAKLSQKSKGWGGASSLNGGAGSASSLRGFGQAPGNLDLRGKGLRASGVGTSLGASSGTVSSLAFTPVQGLELVDPKVQQELSRKRKAEEDRWFKGGTFTQIAGGGADGVFKKPDLPASKKPKT
jgi:U4/U6 small nuclear ribonucleoprotein PRP31